MAKNLALLGKKLGMTRIFADDGTICPVTVLAVGPCPITQIKTQDTDGYNALQIAYDALPAHKVNKPMKGHFEKTENGFFRHLRECRIEDVSGYELGQKLTVELFAQGEKVKVSGVSKGKGFQGAMKRWNFKGLRASHGAEKVHRSTGSVGHATFPGHVFKGKKMPGQMGNAQVTLPNVEIIDVRPEENVVVVKGQIPGPKNGLVMISKK